LRIKESILILALVAISAATYGQKQLLVLKQERVLLRLYPGDEFVYRLKGSKNIVTTYINNLSDTAVVTHRDTVAYHRIDKVYFRQRRFYNTVGTALVIFGAGLFIIDQINVVLVNGQSPDLDSRVSAISVSSMAVGLPLMLFKKKSRKVGYRTRLMMVDKGSGFYKPDTREAIN
jgi:hypothetical protein